MVEYASSFVKRCYGEKFVIFYSDIEPLIMNQANYSEAALVGRITNHNSTTALSPLKEVSNVSEILERYCYNRLELCCGVGLHFFEDGYHNSFVARLILANNMNDVSKLTLTYHSCGGTIKNDYLNFNERYSIKIIPNIH